MIILREAMSTPGHLVSRERIAPRLVPASGGELGRDRLDQARIVVFDLPNQALTGQHIIPADG
jgi:hypothetical protein